MLGGDAAGAMYGGLQLAENISFDGFSRQLMTSKSRPYFAQRGVKLNLPLDKRIPTYVGIYGQHFHPGTPSRMFGT